MPSRRHRRLADLQRRGRAPRTHPCYIEAVKHLSHHDRRAPDQITEEALRPYFRSLRTAQKVAERTFRIPL